jgi:hypothetical protein
MIFEVAAGCLAMWSQCDDSELRFNEREGTARTVQSIESEQGRTSVLGRQLRHGLEWPPGKLHRSVMGRGATSTSETAQVQNSTLSSALTSGV